MALTELYVEWNPDPKERKPLGAVKPKGVNPKVVAVIQAWKHSTRFPNKIYAQLGGAPLLWHTVNRVSLSSHITDTIVAGPELLDVPDGTEQFVYPKAMDKDVLGLYAAANEKYNPDYLVRITSDCPVLDPFLVDFVVGKALQYEADYCSNVLDPTRYTFPDGQDVEVISNKLIMFLNRNVKSKYGREHVTVAFRTRGLWQQMFRTVSIINIKDCGTDKQSVDTPEDLENLEGQGLV